MASVDPDLVMELLETADQSIAGHIGEPDARFMLIATPEGKERVVAMMMEALTEQKLYRWIPNKLSQMMSDRILKIPAFLIVIQKTRGSQEKVDQDYAALSAMLHSFSLLAWERGIGMVWNTESFVHRPSFRNHIGLEAAEKVICIQYMGYTEKIPKGRQRTPAAKKVTFL